MTTGGKQNVFIDQRKKDRIRKRSWIPKDIFLIFLLLSFLGCFVWLWFNRDNKILKKAKETVVLIDTKYDYSGLMCRQRHKKLTDIFVALPHKNGEQRPLPVIQGETMDERLDSMSTYYGYDSKQFRKIGEKGDIKPVVLFCIAWTEGFGSWSDSINNPLNCGNTDGGKRLSFEHYSQSIKCAVNALNGKLLGNKQTVADLSFAGDCTIDCRYIYASSRSSWQINMQNCLGYLYNENMDPWFKFRIE